MGHVFVSAIGDKSSDDEERVHGEEVRQHVCCARHEKMIDVGYGKQINKYTIRRDGPSYTRTKMNGPFRATILGRRIKEDPTHELRNFSNWLNVNHVPSFRFYRPIFTSGKTMAGGLVA